ncbi:MAG: MATE family efflux transporter, partial [Clostridia bacterium]|nr:MATE family efflux transporter [Clostridia bacterium]
MRKINRNICEGPMFLNILLYTFPIILTGVLQLLYNAADLVIVGIYCGSVSVAAVGATGSLTTLLVNFVTGLSVGGSVCVAQAIGAKDEKRASRAIHTAIPIAAIGGFLVGVIGFVFSNNLLMMMGTPDDVLPLSSLYMKIMFAAKPFSMLSVFGAAVLRALGDTKRPMIYFSVSGIANVIMNIF